MSPNTNSASPHSRIPVIFSRLPVIRLSSTRTRPTRGSRTNAAPICDPINPAPPVSRIETFFITKAKFGVIQCFSFGLPNVLPSPHFLNSPPSAVKMPLRCSLNVLCAAGLMRYRCSAAYYGSLRLIAKKILLICSLRNSCTIGLKRCCPNRARKQSTNQCFRANGITQLHRSGLFLEMRQTHSEAAAQRHLKKKYEDQKA